MVSFEMARSFTLASRRLNSSQSLHEAQVNVLHDEEVFAKRSVGTEECASVAR
eukprot:c26894_g1_i1 orf=23-181(-)